MGDPGSIEMKMGIKKCLKLYTPAQLTVQLRKSLPVHRPFLIESRTAYYFHCHSKAQFGIIKDYTVVVFGIIQQFHMLYSTLRFRSLKCLIHH
jgi:hypothetical protein